jgi:hypothetical protein
MIQHFCFQIWNGPIKNLIFLYVTITLLSSAVSIVLLYSHRKLYGMQTGVNEGQNAVGKCSVTGLG